MKTIRDILSVRSHPTVVRLEDASDASWIRESTLMTADLRRHFDALARVLAGPAGSGAFLMGAYGSGKSHFLAWLVQAVRRGELGGARPDVVALSLVDYAAEARLEDVVSAAAGVAVGTSDRRPSWLGRIGRRPDGLLLVLDELSEFLRSKPDARRLNEDVRFLQFLGEVARDARLTIVAAVQEAIEHTGDIEHASYRKIQDRFPLRMLLSPFHVRDLVAGSILVKKDGYDEAVRGVCRRLAEALPGVDVASLTSTYPIHPATLDVLEEVRDRFSRTRGVVAFVTAVLAGDPSRALPPLLDREIGTLVTPDVIVDYFLDVLESRAEFQPIAQQVLVWYRRHLAELFETDRLRELGARLLRLLVLCHLSSQRAGLTADEACAWLLFAPTRLDPAKNRTLVESALTTLATAGRYVRRDGARFVLSVEDDAASRLDVLVQRELSELPEAPVALESIVALGPLGDGFDPFRLPRDTWSPRRVTWSCHERAWSLWFGSEVPPLRAGLGLCARLPWGNRAPVAGLWTVTPAEIELSPALRELAALARLRERVAGTELAPFLDARVAARADVFAVAVRAAYAGATLTGPTGASEPAVPLGPRDTLEGWLDAHALRMLRKAYPSFESYAPVHGPLPAEAYRAFLRHGLARDLGDADAEAWVKVIREAYLVPMGLLARTGRGYTVPARLDKCELVRLVLPLLDAERPPSAYYGHLGGPVYGLVDDQVHLLLLYLVVVGEVDLVKDGRSVRDLYVTLPTPPLYDRVVAGRSLPGEAVAALRAIGEALSVRLPEPLTVASERRAIRAVGEALRQREATLRPVLARLEGAGEAVDALRELARWCGEMDPSENELTAFERLLAKVEVPARLAQRLAETRDLAERLDRQLVELGRVRHLIGQPGLEGAAADLGTPPGALSGDALEAWLARARVALRDYAADYRERHDAFWSAVMARPAWREAVAPVARTRSLGLSASIGALEAAQRRANGLRCRGLGNLDFQARCACGFDGESAPVLEVAVEVEACAARLAEELHHAFATPEVRRRVAAFVESGGSNGHAVRAYLDGLAGWPEIADVDAFDAHLAGVDVVRRISAAELLAPLEGHTYHPDAFLLAVQESVTALGASRLRLDPPAAREPDEVALWCVEQALRHGAPLPRGVGDVAACAARVIPAWVGAESLQRLDTLHLPEPIVSQVLRLVASGDVAAPAGAADLVAAASDAVRPVPVEDPEALAVRASRLYRVHARLHAALGDRWLDRLNGLACTPLSARSVGEVLADHRGSAWLVLDAFGLPLLETIRAAAGDLFPQWTLEATLFAEVARTTTTDAFYGRLAEAADGHAIEKVNAIDDLLHTRRLAFDDLARLAVAELRAALGPVLARLDRARPLLVLGDHGFRLDDSGRAFRHGGPSALERIVPVLRLRVRA